mgnify:CR=1 FL=1
MKIEMTKNRRAERRKMPPMPIKAAARPDRINTPVEVTEKLIDRRHWAGVDDDVAILDRPVIPCE